MNASTSDTLAGQKRLAALLIARYKRNADALPSSGFGLRAKVLSAISLMRGYEAFMYIKLNPYPKVLTLVSTLAHMRNPTTQNWMHPTGPQPATTTYGTYTTANDKLTKIDEPNEYIL